MANTFEVELIYQKNHSVFRWIRERNIKSGGMPLPVPIADKPGGKKGKPVLYGVAQLKKLEKQNTPEGFEVICRIGAFFFNSAANWHLLNWLGRLKDKIWWTSNYVSYDMLKGGRKARAEKIRMVGNRAKVDKVKGRYYHLAAGTGQLTQVDIVTGRVYKSEVYWPAPAGWIDRDLVRRV